MIVEIQPDIEKIEQIYKPEEVKQVLQYFEPLKEFNIPAYIANFNNFVNISKNFPGASPKMIKYFYGLTIESLEQYINTEYGEHNPNHYLVEVHLMSMDYEKYYKNGYFVDLNGIYTGEDFYNVENYKELEDKAQFENYWIAVTIYKCD